MSHILCGCPPDPHNQTNTPTPQLDVPNFGVSSSSDDSEEPSSSLTRVVLAHSAFKAAMDRAVSPDDRFFRKCAAEVNAVSLFFPDIKVDGLRIAFTAWLAFACVMDDILETLDMEDRELALCETIELLTYGKSLPTTNSLLNVASN
jgi:hypothetical protein